MDSYRQPKTSYYLFKSFRSPQIQKESLAETGPFVYIANEMTPFSPKDVTVFSNCDKVVLTINKMVNNVFTNVNQERVCHIPSFTFLILLIM